MKCKKNKSVLQNVKYVKALNSNFAVLFFYHFLSRGNKKKKLRLSHPSFLLPSFFKKNFGKKMIVV